MEVLIPNSIQHVVLDFIVPVKICQLLEMLVLKEILEAADRLLLRRESVKAHRGRIAANGEDSKFA